MDGREDAMLEAFGAMRGTWLLAMVGRRVPSLPHDMAAALMADLIVAAAIIIHPGSRPTRLDPDRPPSSSHSSVSSSSTTYTTRACSDPQPASSPSAASCKHAQICHPHSTSLSRPPLQLLLRPTSPQPPTDNEFSALTTSCIFSSQRSSTCILSTTPSRSQLISPRTSASASQAPTRVSTRRSYPSNGDHSRPSRTTARSKHPSAWPSEHQHITARHASRRSKQTHPILLARPPADATPA